MGHERQLDEALDALGHEYRRRLLIALREHNPQVATDPQGSEATLRTEAGASEDAMAPQAMIYYSHLPKLESYEFIEWDRNANDISKGCRFDELRSLLDVVEDQ